MQIKKIGIMGGTFDPIHYGHLMLAEQIRASYSLDQIVFIPVGNAPHKQEHKPTDKMHRYMMTMLATASNPHFTVSDIEIKKEVITYAIDTIKELRVLYNTPVELYFITGADAIILLDTWKSYKELVKYVKFIGASRPGVDEHVLKEKIEELSLELGAHIELCSVPALAISSTDIRNRVCEGKSIKYLLPETVENYICKEKLYLC
ncbi:nicotinate-nucleotide adenylyltransferase [Fusibacter ferrireducens]|nr:nicotinate-nucleotide adenylyltransferase [Fusibacter ferrireducens]